MDAREKGRRMIQLLFVTCMAAAPAQCQDHRLILGDMSPAACLRAAQPELARWMESHPDLRIRRWRCSRLS
jgi:hypothetical protein